MRIAIRGAVSQRARCVWLIRMSEPQRMLCSRSTKNIAPVARHPHMTKLIRRASAEARAFRNRDAEAIGGKQKMAHNKAPKATRDASGTVEHDAHDAPQIEAPRKPRFAPVTFSAECGVS